MADFRARRVRASRRHRGRRPPQHADVGLASSRRSGVRDDVDQMPAQQLQPLPCESCEHATRCRRDAFECRAFTRWQKSGHWKAQHRSRPDAGIAITTTVSRVTEREKRPTTTRLIAERIEQHVEREIQPEPANVIELRGENRQSAQAHDPAQAIHVAPAVTSGASEIAPAAPSCEVSLQIETERRGVEHYPQPQVDAPQLSFREAINKFAAELLTKALAEAGGERQAAAAALRVNRTHLHQLIRKLGVDVKPNLKLRGRRRSA